MDNVYALTLTIQNFKAWNARGLSARPLAFYFKKIKLKLKAVDTFCIFY